MGIKGEIISGIKWTAIEKYTSKAISVLTFMILTRVFEPKLFGLFAMAFILIIVYGQRWLPIVPILRVLAVYSAGIPLFFKMDSIFTACGKPKWSFYLDCLSLSTLAITILPFTRFFGLVGVGYSKLFSDLIIFPFSLYLAKRLINLRLKEIFAVIKTPVIGSLFLTLVITLLKEIPPVMVIKNLDFSLFIQSVFLSLLIYLLTLILIDKKFIFETKDLIFNRK